MQYACATLDAQYKKRLHFGQEDPVAQVFVLPSDRHPGV